jgi:hypothetical protein
VLREVEEETDLQLSSLSCGSPSPSSPPLQAASVSTPALSARPTLAAQPTSPPGPLSTTAIASAFATGFAFDGFIFAELTNSISSGILTASSPKPSPTLLTSPLEQSLRLHQHLHHSFEPHLHHHLSMFSRRHGGRSCVINVTKIHMTYLIATVLSVILKKTETLPTSMTCKPCYVCMMMPE